MIQIKRVILMFWKLTGTHYGQMAAFFDWFVHGLEPTYVGGYVVDMQNLPMELHYTVIMVALLLFIEYKQEYEEIL